MLSRSEFFYGLFGFKKISNRLQLLLIVSTHVLAWLLFLLLPLLFFRVQIRDESFYLRELINKLFLIGLFYFNYFFLIPRYFIKDKIGRYMLLAVLSIIIIYCQHILTEQIFFNYLVKHSLPVVRGLDPLQAFSQTGNDGLGFIRAGQRFFQPGLMMRADHSGRPLLSIPPHIYFVILRNVISSSFFLLLIGGFIHLAFSFIRAQNEKKALENASLHAEVNLLKSQINPHFLFNTLNSIYAQAYQKSENTEKSILKLSEILRYMIYDATPEKIALEKDIQYISSYIDLQKLRLSSKITLDYSVTGDPKGVSIAPLLLITFIENAFKHGISYTKPSTILIAIAVADKTIDLLVRNPLLPEDKTLQSGMGLKNAVRRLDLIYPEKYFLDITRDHGYHLVNLQINLADD